MASIIALATMTLPPSHQAGAIESPMWGSANAKDHIVLAGERELDADEFRAEFASHVSGRIGVNRDVLVYVHGFNTSFEELRLRAAQIVADSHFGGVPVLFTWPTKAQVFGYVSDKDSAMASRDALQDVLTQISATPGVGKIHILAHSMGGWLAMEALRQAALSGHRDLDGHLGEVMLASPDIDMEVFDFADGASIRPADVTVFATANDRALSLSSALAQSRQRVGAINPANPEDRAKIEARGRQSLRSFFGLRRLHRSRRLRRRAGCAALDRRANGGAARGRDQHGLGHRRQRLRREAAELMYTPCL